jgi:hypothetical protein
VGDESAVSDVVPRRGSHVKPLLAPRMVEGADDITKTRNGNGKREVVDANSLLPMARIQAGPRSCQTNLDKHLVHSDDHGSSVLDLLVKPHNNRKEQNCLFDWKKEERVKRLNEDDIEV